MIAYEWRGAFTNAEVEALHAAGFGIVRDTTTTADRATRAGADGGRVDGSVGLGRSPGGWWERVRRHSLGWVCARHDGVLVGFVNVAWDGGAHAFVLDTVVAEGSRRQGVGAHLVRIAADQARAAGVDWLHVDFEPHLRGFYLDACGFTPTDAGLIALTA
ncbi:N-acetyltransferase [Asanoa ishikariensis]|uniref:Acetyltransferase (GNAT) family protein n=1 Tax=Asanoa ishikariensis TaxID=137265 RepID=A0A1H3KYA8_9ACTN|nr:GNAT family N-acetyltransferase [Asanoa ishikariensis]GIF69611.1 N-acetyltransferase [Asanoa ishikariensis]SDY57152.1 Acetyltransferase (GNAT) family protein [Asanoa ishikariensis]